MPSHASAKSSVRVRHTLLLGLAVVLVAGCASSDWVEVRDTPRNPLAATLDLMSPLGPKPTDRTMQLLRRYDLAGLWRHGDRAALLARLEEIQRQEPHREHDYAMAEVAYITATQAEKFHRDRALEFYGTALVHAYRYLFEYDGHLASNPYDPQFRGASDLYNQSLEGMLRLVRRDGDLRPGVSQTVQTANHVCTFDIVLHSTGWHAEDFDRFEFVSDYQVQGLQNHYQTYGLGVPLIAVRRTDEAEGTADDYYPPDLCFPLTAFLRVERSEHSANLCFVLELHDTLDRHSIEVAGRNVPLEADLSTPLAFFLDQPEFKDSKISTLGLLKPGKVKDLQGIYMLEPFDPNKMPVVMVHGLWSSPITWMEMYNDLRSDPLVREHYQFWFYLYPSGQPFWISATQMREDLALARRRLDPDRRQPALDQTVLVGHSMGGLLSKMQSVDSDDAFWRTVSDRSLAELDADPDDVRMLANTYFFRPSPSVSRVVTLGTPHRGSPFANDLTRWLSNKLIKLPRSMVRGRDDLLARNRGAFHRDAPLKITTSIDSLAPDSPLLPVLYEAPPGPWVAYHNVVGRDPDPGWLRKRIVGEGDGVVALTSAQLDEVQQLRSQIIVPADHVSVHRHPQSILEVRRVLLEQLTELHEFPHGRDAQVATADESSPSYTTEVR